MRESNGDSSGPCVGKNILTNPEAVRSKDFRMSDPADPSLSSEFERSSRNRDQG